MITQEEYIAQNALGYEGDTFIHDELKKLCTRYNVNLVIETGSYRGATTKKLVELPGIDYVYTIEVVEENYKVAKQELINISNVLSLHGNSAYVMPHILKLPWEPGVNFLFFLDAHWEDFNPLLDELKIIAEFKLKPVIFIHDFKVPDRPDLGYDSYKGQDYDFEWIKQSIERIYGENGYDYHYNSEASGAKRGVIYIYPKA